MSVILCMPTLEDFLHHPIATLEKALHLRKQIDQLNEALKELFGPSPVSLGGMQTSAPKKRGRPRKESAVVDAGNEVGNGLVGAGQKKKRTMSAQAKAKIAAAQRARWAKSKGTATPAPVAKVKKKKGGISPEGLARIKAAQKLRWAKFRKGK